MKNDDTLAYDLFKIEELPSDKRDERIIRYLPRFIFSTIALLLLWIFLWVKLNFWYMVFTNLLMIVSLLIVRSILLRQKVEISVHLLLLSTMLYVFATCYIISGPGGENLGSVHYWLFVIIVVAFFVFTKKVLFRCLYTIICTLGFLGVEYAVIPFEPIYSFDIAIKYGAHIVTVLSVILIISFFLHLIVNDYNSAEEKISDSNNRMEKLLFNILPEKIAQRLKKDGKTFADGFVDCSVLFADLAGFTNWANEKQPDEVVTMLNRLFSKFDDLCEQFEIEKIKTIGDAYMVAAGVPEKDPDHAYKITMYALKMKEIIRKEPGLNIRIGINSGVVVAGIIGKKRFLYDLWGDSVNVASRMESTGINGEIQISESTYEKIKHHNCFSFSNKKSITIKGKGDMITYLVRGKS